MSLNGVLVPLGTGMYTVTRTAEGVRVNGRYIPGAVTTLTIGAGIEQMTGRALQDLPEGQRGDEAIKIFTAAPLLTRRPGFEPDKITYRPPGYEADGEPWTVTQVAVCEGFGETHYEATACRAPSPVGVVP